MRQRDPELQYCPKCDEEYRAEIKVCADCAVELISGRDIIAIESARQRKQVTRSMELSADDDLVNIRKGTLLEMKKLQEVLAKEHIPSLITGEKSSNCGKGCCGTEIFYKSREKTGRRLWMFWPKSLSGQRPLTTTT